MVPPYLPPWEPAGCPQAVSAVSSGLPCPWCWRPWSCGSAFEGGSTWDPWGGVRARSHCRSPLKREVLSSAWHSVVRFTVLRFPFRGCGVYPSGSQGVSCVAPWVLSFLEVGVSVGLCGRTPLPSSTPITGGSTVSASCRHSQQHSMPPRPRRASDTVVGCRPPLHVQRGPCKEYHLGLGARLVEEGGPSLRALVASFRCPMFCVTVPEEICV